MTEASVSGCLLLATALNLRNMNLERFSIECRNTKTKVSVLANYKEQRQSSEPNKTRGNDI